MTGEALAWRMSVEQGEKKYPMFYLIRIIRTVYYIYIIYIYVTQCFMRLGVTLNCGFFYIADQPTIKAVGPWQKRLDISGIHDVQI